MRQVGCPNITRSGRQESARSERGSTLGKGRVLLGHRGLVAVISLALVSLFFLPSEAGAAARFRVFTIPTSNSGPEVITAGPDGNLWFTENSGNKIGRITTAGVIMEFPSPTANGWPEGITAGPDGNLWFTEEGGNKIGRITTAGAITEFTVPTASGVPIGITAGPDGNLWFTEEVGNKIGRITAAGTITESRKTNATRPTGIAAGPDGNVWLLEALGNAIAEFNIP